MLTGIPSDAVYRPADAALSEDGDFAWASLLLDSRFTQPLLRRDSTPRVPGWVWIAGLVGVSCIVFLLLLSGESMPGAILEAAVLVGVVGFLVIGVAAYLLPCVIAYRHPRHPYATGIAIVNVCLGWTLLGWVGALAWAACRPHRS